MTQSEKEELIEQIKTIEYHRLRGLEIIQKTIEIIEEIPTDEEEDLSFHKKYMEEHRDYYKKNLRT